MSSDSWKKTFTIFPETFGDKRGKSWTRALRGQMTSWNYGHKYSLQDISNCVALFAMGRCDILALGPFLDIVPLKSMQARWWLWRGAIRTVRALKNVLGWQIELCWFSLKRKLWSWNEKRAVFKVPKRLVQKERKQYILQYPLKIRQEKNTFCCKREDVH